MMIKNIIKRARIYYKEKRHARDVKNYLRDFPKSELTNTYKKSIDEYWSRYGVKVSGKWHQLFTATSGVEDTRYIDIGLFYSKIIGRLNFHPVSMAFDDKNRYDVLVSDFKQPQTILKNVNGLFLDKNNCFIEKYEAEKILNTVNKCIVKPSMETSGGKGIRVLDQESKDERKNIVEALLKEKNYIVQDFIKQNSELEKLNPSSVNTIRILSFLWKGKVYILSSIIRVGDADSKLVVCSTDIGKINEDGTLDSSFMDKSLHIRDDLDICNIADKIKLPNYNQIIEYVKRKHKELYYFSIVGWDFTIDDKDDPVFIELNTKWPGIQAKQCLDGPLFGDLTDEVMEYVFSDKQAILDGVSIIL